MSGMTKPILPKPMIINLNWNLRIHKKFDTSNTFVKTSHYLNHYCLLRCLGTPLPIHAFLAEMFMILIITRQIWGIWKLRPAYSPEMPNLGQNRWCFVPCDLEIWWMTWKTIGHLSFAVSSFVQHFIAIGEFKLELQSVNTQFGSIQRFLEPCDLEIWRMTLKNNRAPLLCYFKLYASFHSHQWIQAGVTVRKRPIWVKFNDY